LALISSSVSGRVVTEVTRICSMIATGTRCGMTSSAVRPATVMRTLERV
jgi:hypothetical protein